MVLYPRPGGDAGPFFVSVVSRTVCVILTFAVEVQRMVELVHVF
jgi:hypothetical protein